MVVERVDDYSYRFEYKKDQDASPQEVIVTISSKIKSPKMRHDLAEKVADNFQHYQPKLAQSSKAFQLNDKQWNYQRTDRLSRGMKMASRMSSLIHSEGEDGIIRFTVSPAKVDKSLANPKAKAIAHKSLESLFTFEFKPSRDPFTELTTLAFQEYEDHFKALDKQKPEDCNTCLYIEGAYTGQRLVLVDKDNVKFQDPLKNRRTIDTYKAFLTKHYGKEKISYIQHLYGFDLDKIDRLTPEHVFRMNMGVQNIEIKDIDQMLAKLSRLRQIMDSDEAEDILNIPLQDLFATKGGIPGHLGKEIRSLQLTGQQLQGLQAAIRKDKGEDHPVSLGDVKEWLDSNMPQGSSAEKLTPAEFNRMLSLLKADSEEVEASYSGRKIQDYIHGGYTMAETGTYKPWIDQQEILQIFPSLINSRDLMEYHEKLTQVVCKKHLAREHPTEGYRVGALIPAPQGQDGQMRWYKVTDCCSNQHGLFSYTLKKACQDDTLDPIFLYRNTSPDASSMHGQSSLLNDFDSSNSPGHKGLDRSNYYEEKFFHERTIPIWVGYNYSASLKLEAGVNNQEEAEAVFEDLQAAGDEFLEDTLRQIKRKDLLTLVRENSAVLEDLAGSDASLFGTIGSDFDSNFLSVYNTILKRYLHETPPDSPTKKYLQQMKKDALKLTTELERFPIERLPTDLATGINKLEQELHDHIIEPKTPSRPKEFLFSKSNDRFNLKIYDLLEAGKWKEAVEEMKEWSNDLEAYGDELGEGIGSKTAESFSISGHSLGGAASQVRMASSTLLQHRIPLPGKSCTGYFFDDPKINRETNEEFKAVGNAHKDLFNRLAIKFAILRSNEAGDFVPLAGEEHLGSAFSQKEADELMEWLFFVGVVNERQSSAKTRSVALAEGVHLTQFYEGEGAYSKEEGADFIIRTFDSYEQGRFDSGDLKLIKEKWKLSPAFLDLAALRGSNHPLITLLKRSLKDNENIRGREFTDSRGVFCVTEEGIISQQ